MAIDHTVTLGVASGGNILSRSFNLSGGQEIDIAELIPDNTTDLPIAFAAVRSKIQNFYLVSDGALTVEVNSAGTPNASFALVAGKPVIWYVGHPVPITTLFPTSDITGLFATNAGGDPVNLFIKALIDLT